MKKLGLYLHFPFCVNKCKYCDFLSFEIHNKEVYLDYAKAMALEVLAWKDKLLAHEIDTIFFGGGTPSLMSNKGIDLIVKALNELNLSEDLEFTMEANPKTVDYKKLSFYKDLGINRLSLGVQSLDEEILQFLGRIHDAEDFIINYEEARKAGFENINVDLMFSIPNQSLVQWMDTIKKVIQLKPEHISLYSLMIEKNTPLSNMRDVGAFKEINDDLDRKMYWEAVNVFSVNEYEHYEISNMALHSHFCAHNMKYWSMQDYIGIGVGAHSFFYHQRFSNETDLNKYIKNANNNIKNRIWEYQNSRNDNISEYIFTGFRKIQGIDLKAYEKYFGTDINEHFEEQINIFINKKWMIKNGKYLKLTPIGLDISNQILAEFILPNT